MLVSIKDIPFYAIYAQDSLCTHITRPALARLGVFHPNLAWLSSMQIDMSLHAVVNGATFICCLDLHIAEGQSSSVLTGTPYVSPLTLIPATLLRICCIHLLLNFTHLPNGAEILPDASPTLSVSQSADITASCPFPCPDAAVLSSEAVASPQKFTVVTEKDGRSYYVKKRKDGKEIRVPAELLFCRRSRFYGRNGTGSHGFGDFLLVSSTDGQGIICWRFRLTCVQEAPDCLKYCYLAQLSALDSIVGNEEANEPKIHPGWEVLVNGICSVALPSSSSPTAKIPTFPAILSPSRPKYFMLVRGGGRHAPTELGGGWITYCAIPSETRWSRLQCPGGRDGTNVWN
ncbi:hypothetical protein GGX14DRAFT_403722 [Mycena pura]|uniref:Uncharacterized protein n=1 Tax=Mycena pura TaxID=153505 RepID=A0AAD6UZ66_9AGAR|nr:hypothetical protein GGX14DRAFT_403722 [Mycena pura]